MTRDEYDNLAEPNLPEEYDTMEMPDTFFENLYAANQVNSPLYSLWQGQLYDNLRATYVSDKDAMQVSRHLNKGEVDEALELTEDLLEPEGEEQ
jgi:hypothetical protein